MKTVGLITEYNPFHNGHLYHLQQAKKRTGADYAVVVMSGDFVQRGEPALMDKYARTRMALLGGADLIIELPAVYSTGSAEYFAAGAVSILDRLGIVDTLCFGCETSNLNVLGTVAALLAEEPEEFVLPLKEALKEGLSYPKARSLALCKALRSMGQPEEFITLCREALNTPNNILGIEYLKALIRLDSPILPVPIKRVVSGYHDEQLSAHSGISSATAIRGLLREGKKMAAAASLPGHVPAFVYDWMKDAFGRAFPIYPDAVSLPLHCRLLTESFETLLSYQDMSEDLAAKIEKQLEGYESFSSFISALNTRDMTGTRLSRTLLHVLLGIRKDDVTAFMANGITGYARILGFRKTAAPLLTEMKEITSIPLITRPASADRILSPLFNQMLKLDISASHIYGALMTDQYQTKPPTEYRRPLIII